MIKKIHQLNNIKNKPKCNKKSIEITTLNQKLIKKEFTMKKIRKGLIFLFIITLILSFTACGRNKAPDTKNKNATNIANEKKAEEIEKAISAIGADITLDSDKAISDASAAYKNASTEVQKLVKNYDKLKEAETKLKALKKKRAEELLPNLRGAEDTVQKAHYYFPKQIPWYDGNWCVDERSFVLPYFSKQNNDVYLRLICHYTGDDWVFYNNIIFAVDDKRYTKVCNSSDISRDNGGGVVWETYDKEASDSDIKLLKEIANSSKTIVRFEGKDRQHDFTVNSADKKAISELLIVYEGLK